MTTRSLIIAIVLAAGSGPVLAQVQASKDEQGAYLVPFDTDRNRIELAVANTTDKTYEDVEVRASDTPSWLTIEPSTVILDEITSDDESLASFTFSSDDSAPTEQTETLTFEVYSGDKLIATKQIEIVVELPTELVLRGNYPNPFNPSTTIGFVQPADGDVELEIFDALGGRVELLSKNAAKRGQQTFRWNATNDATGVYFYRLELRPENGERQTKLGKMMLIK